MIPGDEGNYPYLKRKKSRVESIWNNWQKSMSFRRRSTRMETFYLFKKDCGFWTHSEKEAEAAFSKT